jgi:predicted  nucleic acid-binding Zn-ribbon protein
MSVKCTDIGAFFISEGFDKDKRNTGRPRLKKQIALLIELQTIDQDIRTLNTKKQTLPEKASELDQTLKARKEKTEEERQGLEGLNKLHKEKESELKQGQEKLRKAKERLLEVKTNKEYQAMLTEIDTVEKSNGRIEEEILVLYDRIDEKKGFVKSHEKDLKQYQGSYEAERKQIDAELSSIDGELEIQQKKFEALVPALKPDLLRRYEMIKGRRNGVAVVSARNAVCSGCNMNLPPQLYNELQRSEELICCPNCNRILYWDETTNGG